jgi:hypothetical protein
MTLPRAPRAEVRCAAPVIARCFVAREPAPRRRCGVAAKPTTRPRGARLRVRPRQPAAQLGPGRACAWPDTPREHAAAACVCARGITARCAQRETTHERGAAPLRAHSTREAPATRLALRPAPGRAAWRLRLLEAPRSARPAPCVTRRVLTTAALVAPPRSPFLSGNTTGRSPPPLLRLAPSCRRLRRCAGARGARVAWTA